MAKKALVDSILKLYSKLGGNVNEVLGTRSNINFLGVGKSPEGFIDSTINIDAIGALGKNKVLEELKSSIGYLTADKLNDVQAGKLYENMLKVDNVFNPKQVANITDLATGTGNLDAKGLAALRERPGVFDISTNKQVYYDDLPPPGSRGGADDIAAPVQQYSNEIDALETMVTNRAGNDFIAGYVDDIYKNAGAVSSVDVPKKRAAARLFLNSMLKKETDLLPSAKGGTLESVVSEADYKFITEGGGGPLGDPLVLVKKYFGDEIAKRLPLDTRTEVIDTFVDNVRFTKDKAGFATDDPRFNPDDLPEFAGGGRAGFKFGGLGRFSKASVLIERLKNTIKDSQGKTDELSVYVNKTFPGFIEEIKANPKLAENEQVWKTLGIEGLPKDQRLVVHSDDTVDFFTQTKFGPHNIELVEKFMAKHPFLSREDALRILKMEPEDRVLEITRLQVLNNRTKNAHGGLAKILEV